MKVLVVEDDHKIANAIKKGLTHEAYAVDVVYEGVDGLEYASTGTYDIIVLDRMLPGFNGAEITRRLREKKIHTPILLLTAMGQIEDRVEGLDSGADDYLVKPFAFTELFARLRALARRPKQSVSNIISVSDLEINTTNSTVHRAGKELRLSGKEYALLEYLTRHKNTVVSKDRIMDSVWAYDSTVTPNAIEAYVKLLRQKVDKPFPGHELIQTVRGFGYKITDTI